MSGKEIIIDTNIILYLLSGSDTLENYLQGKDIYISFITELELIPSKTASNNDEGKITELLNECSIIPLNNRIKEKYFEIRRNHKLKLPDAVIAATAIAFDFPIITADKQFKTVSKLNVISYQHDIKLT